MKKVLALLLAGIMTVGMSVSVFAAGSAAGTPDKAAPEATTADGQKVTLSTTYDSPEETQAAEKVAAAPTEVLSEIGVATDEAKELNFVGVWNVPLTKGATITFSIPEVTPDSKVVVAHFIAGQGWVKEDVTVGKGTVTVTFEHGSPVAIFVEKTSTVPADKADTANKGGTTNTGSASGSSSPKTGELPVMPLVAAVVAVSVIGMVASKKYHA